MSTLIKSEDLSVTINNHGAEISSVKNKEGLEFMWQAKSDVWPRHAPVLFPIVGKLKDDKFRYKGVDYALGQHGFARDLPFEIIERTNSSCTFGLKSTSETLKKFPFEFDFKIIYQLSGNELNTTYKIHNPSSSLIIFAVGAHPGFNCPLLPSEKFDDYFLEFETDRLSLTKLNNGLRLSEKKELTLTDKKIPVSVQLFDQDALVFENRQINSVTLRSNKSSHQIKMESKGWPYFGIWSKKSCDQFICLEPWYGIADAQNTNSDFTVKEGMIHLQAGKEFACSFLTTFT